MGAKTPVRREFGSLISDIRLPYRPVPFLKWAGGKSQLLDQIEAFLPAEYETYYEPFLGGGAVFFRLDPPRAVLTDSNPELINAFRVVRDEPEALIVALDGHHPKRSDKDYYYKIRARDPCKMTSVERAARTIFLNKTCYNGLYRVNAKGQFNVPFGKYKNPSLYDRNNVLAASSVLRGKIIDTADYMEICSYPKRGDFIYLDPPYQPLSATSSFTGYTKDAFSEEDQRELKNTYEALDRRGCKVMLSNSATDLVKSLYHEYTIRTVKAPRAINRNALGRGAIDEFLILNYPVE